MRDNLKKLHDGKSHHFKAVFTTTTDKRFSPFTRMIKNVTYKGKEVANHLWIKETEAIKLLNLKGEETFTFFAIVYVYKRRRKNCKITKLFDFGLTGLYNIQKDETRKEINTMEQEKKYVIITYKTNTIYQDIRFDFERKTVWLTQSEISKISGLDIKTLSRRLLQLEKSDNIDLQSSKMRITQNNRKVNIYSSLYLFKLIAKIECQKLSDFIAWCEIIFQTKDFDNYKLVRFTQDNLELEVRFTNDYETAWLNQNEIASLYGVSQQNISAHIINIFQQGELEKVSVHKFFLCTDKDRKTYEVEYYNLDMILSIGYRVNSKRGIAFRKWANSVLKDFLIKGYAINEKRIKSLGKTIDIQNKMLSMTMDVDYQELSSVISEYTRALDLLDDYDHQQLSKPKGSETIYRLTYEDAIDVISSMKYGQTSTIFGVEKEEGKLNGILEAVYMNVFGQEAYPSLEDKAAHLLYFLVKDHPFYDGCKRIAATLFLEFLNRNHALIKNGHLIISNDALTAITLLTAVSNPDEMETIVSVIENILVKK